MRIPGLGGAVMAKLGVIPQQIAPGDIYPALERGTIDAAEWATPYDDFKFGFYKVAPYYYAPGWWEGQATGAPVRQQGRNGMSCRSSTRASSRWRRLRHGPHTPPPTTRTTPAVCVSCVAAGGKLRFFSKEILDAAYDASFQTFDELKAKSPAFAKLYDPWKKYLDTVELYYRVGDASYDNYIYDKRVKG